MKHKAKRKEIKRILSLLEDKHRRGFRLMYTQPVDFDRDIDLVVDELPDIRVSWALQQCLNSYHQLFDILKNA